MATKATELPAGTHEEATFDYSSLPLILKLSNWMSWRAVVNNLRPGSWVDLMCGMRAMLQQSQLKNRKITQFVALDQEIDEGDPRFGPMADERPGDMPIVLAVVEVVDPPRLSRR